MLCERSEATKRRKIPVHREHAVCHNENARMASAQPLQQHLYMARIGMPISDYGCARKSRSGPETSMRELVDHDQICFFDQGGNDPNIGEITRTEDAIRLRIF